MKKFTITKIYRTKKDKEGNPLKTKDGRDYERVAIKVKEMGDDWISGFGSNRNQNWKEGDVVELEISQKYAPNGKVYNNFKEPNVFALINRRIDLLEARITVLEGDEIKKDEKETENEEEISTEDIPF